MRSHPSAFVWTEDLQTLHRTFFALKERFLKDDAAVDSQPEINSIFYQPNVTSGISDAQEHTIVLRIEDAVCEDCRMTALVCWYEPTEPLSKRSTCFLHVHLMPFRLEGCVRVSVTTTTTNRLVNSLTSSVNVLLLELKLGGQFEKLPNSIYIYLHAYTVKRYILHNAS